jgi:hypothetical protein
MPHTPRTLKQIHPIEFDYGIDFRAIYKPMGEGHIFTRKVD